MARRFGRPPDGGFEDDESGDEPGRGADAPERLLRPSRLTQCFSTSRALAARPPCGSSSASWRSSSPPASSSSASAPRAGSTRSTRPAAARPTRRSSSRSRTLRKRSRPRPDDPEPLASLIVIRGQSGTRQLEVDEETGQPIALTDDSRAEYEEAISLWQEYLELEPRKVNAAAAGAVVQAYRFLGDARGAIAAQRALVKSDPRSPNFVALAFLLYTDFQIEEADEARDQAIAKADGDTKKQLTEEFEEIRKQAVKAEEQQKKQPELRDRREPRAVRSIRRPQPNRSGHPDTLTLATIEDLPGR